MAYSIDEYVGNGTRVDHTLSFSYISMSHVKVEVAEKEVTFVWLSKTQIRLDAAPVSGVKYRIYRKTPTGSLLADFQDGSLLDKDVLDIVTLQNLYVSQETFDKAEGSTSLACAYRDEAHGYAELANQHRTDSYISLQGAVASSAESLAYRNTAKDYMDTTSVSKEAAKASQDAAKVSQDAARASEIQASTYKAQVTAEGAKQVSIITAEGNAQVSRVMTEGSSQIGELKTEGNTQVARLDDVVVNSGLSRGIRQTQLSGPLLSVYGSYQVRLWASANDRFIGVLANGFTDIGSRDILVRIDTVKTISLVGASSGRVFLYVDQYGNLGYDVVRPTVQKGGSTEGKSVVFDYERMITLVNQQILPRLYLGEGTWNGSIISNFVAYPKGDTWSSPMFSWMSNSTITFDAPWGHIHSIFEVWGKDSADNWIPQGISNADGLWIGGNRYLNGVEGKVKFKMMNIAGAEGNTLSMLAKRRF